MITRLRSKFPATCFAGVEGEYILSGEAALRGEKESSASPPFSRDPPPREQQRTWGLRGGFKDEEGESESRRDAFTIREGCVGGRATRVHARIRARAIVWQTVVWRSGFGSAIIRIRNLFLPRGSTTTTSSYILLSPRRFPPSPDPEPRPDAHEQQPWRSRV